MLEDTKVTKARSQTHALILTKNAHTMVHGKSILGRLNTFIAVKVTNIVGSMWCAYVFCLLALISLPAAVASKSAIVIVAWIAQTFLQLVLLPIIIVGQNVQAAASDARAESDHEMLIAIHTLTAEIYRLNEQQKKILEELETGK